MNDIRAFCTEIRKLMEHAPGPEWCDVDEEAWRLLIELCKRISDRGIRFRDSHGTGWNAEGWQVMFFIRNSQFRPKWDALENKVREVYRMQVMAGNEADVRRHVIAPAPPANRQLESPSQPMLGQAAGSEELPAWLEEFPSKDHGGPFDQILLRPLLKLSDYEARKACRIIKAENDKWEREKREAANKPKYDRSDQDAYESRLKKAVRHLQTKGE